ncbi:MAG TPA: GGDEF domain-containing protein [Arenimonas sp.]|nr:GGDEF domain-containing protein [Arenimonas sp.]
MADASTLLAVVILLTGVSALWWQLLAWPWRIAPKATQRLALGNLMLALSVAAVLGRDQGASWVHWPLADLLGLAAFVLVRASVQALFRLPSSRRYDLSVWLLAAAFDLSVAPSAASTPVFAAVYSLALAALLGPLAWDIYRPAAREFSAALGLSVMLPFALATLLMLARGLPVLLGLLLSREPAQVVAEADGAFEHWSYVLLVLMVNASLMACVLTRMVQVMRRHARQDSLTGLANRRAFEQRWQLEQQRNVRDGRCHALALIDLDHFKQINDRHGHAAGDAVLRHVADTLLPALRPCDVLARFGGEEFALLLPEINEEVASRVAERLRQRLADASLRWRDVDLSVRASVGVGDSRHLQGVALLQRVDAALYAAKSSGRDRVCRVSQLPAAAVLSPSGDAQAALGA